MAPGNETLDAMIAGLSHPALLVEVILKGVLVLGLALLAVRACRRRSAAVAHLVLGVALAANLVLPLLAVVAPTWQASSLPLVGAAWQLDLTLPGLVPPEPEPPEHVPPNSVSPVLVPLNQDNPAAPAETGGTPIANLQWGRWLLGVWLGGALLVSIRLVAALAVVGRILAVAQPVPDTAWGNTARHCRKKMRIRRDVPVLLSDRATVPFTWGWLRPRIIMPGESRQWPRRKLEIVLLHELAHVKRWDAVTTGVAQLAAIVYWFNPLLWFARRGLLVERERASDDRVLEAGVSPTAYAGYLLEIARTVRNRNWLPELQVAMAQRTALEERIMTIVQHRGNRTRLTSGRLATGLLAATLLVLLLAGVQIFAHENDSAPVAGDAAIRTETTGGDAPADGTRASDGDIERINALLDGFYGALNRGDDYDDVAARYLAVSYFDDHSLTFENWPEQRRKQVMRNTISHVRAALAGEQAQEGGTIQLKEPLEIDHRNPAGISYRAELLDCRHRDGEFLLTQNVNIESGLAGEKQSLARDLRLSIELVEENGSLKIRRYDGGISIQRMDVDTPFGPILVVLLEHDATAAPAGPMLFKSIPRSIVPENVNLIPLRAADSGS